MIHIMLCIHIKYAEKVFAKIEDYISQCALLHVEEGLLYIRVTVPFTKKVIIG